ncbi:hypothetical protein [Bacillus paranthracis]|uniref:hypothetical protein n=1 Tax=Bacillus paranthracis TaxID=2026186 RepID=UPI003D658E81
MTDKISVVIEDPKTIEFDVQNDKVVMLFDGNKELVIPVKKYTTDDFKNEMKNPTYQQLTDEFATYQAENRSMYEGYNDALEELEAAEDNYKELLTAKATGKNPTADVDGAVQAVANARMKVETLEKVKKDYLFNSVYTPQQIKASYESARNKVLGKYYRYDAHYLKPLEKLSVLVKGNVVSADSALSSLNNDIEYNIFPQRRYEKNFYGQMVSPYSNETYENAYPYNPS